ncbi:MAG: prolipoprotein diacylglyceryl transferase [Rhodobacteraceae bacterium]|nr:prolipoprotein diacylglyceryl transferase [Paracoccaceae bacterium]
MDYIPFPNISPNLVAFEVFGFTIALRWYALAYIAGLLIGWWIIRRSLARLALWQGQPPATAEQIERFFTWTIVGVILGGRIGFVLFYRLDHYLANPAEILRVWEGGMSFHGGFLGVVVAGLLFCRQERIPVLAMGDLLAMAAPPGLFLGRLANFVNAELWGRQTDLPWGVAFPGEAAQNCGPLIDICARHPSQLYEAALEGLLLGAALLWLGWRGGWLRWPGRLMGLFLAGYGAARFVVEFVRQPDPQFISEGNPLGLALQSGGYGLTMGQLLSLPMIILGLWFILRARPA